MAILSILQWQWSKLMRTTAVLLVLCPWQRRLLRLFVRHQFSYPLLFEIIRPARGILVVKCRMDFFAYAFLANLLDFSLGIRGWP